MLNREYIIEQRTSNMVLCKSDKKTKHRKSKKTVKRGRGLFDRIIDKLPFELHLPSYQYCGPGTKLEKRLARGDKGVNKLDEFCKEHDIAYANHKDSAERYKADKKLGAEALKRVFSKDAKLGERASSLLVTAAMKAKNGLSKIGLGISNKRMKIPKNIVFATLVKDARNGIKKSRARTVDSAIKAAVRSAKKTAKGKRIKMPRIIKVPTFTGGILPILPILAGLSAIGAITGSVAGVVKTAKDIKVARDALDEYKRHNKAMEIKVGKGLYLRPHSTGKGLYLRPASKNR